MSATTVLAVYAGEEGPASETRRSRLYEGADEGESSVVLTALTACTVET